MHTPTQRFLTALGVAALAGGLPTSARQTPSPLPELKLPAGFYAEVYAEKVDNARSMALGPQGTVFVGSQYSGKVYAVVDTDKDNKADRVVVIASGLDQPNGVAMRNGALYVATASRLLRFDDIEKHLDAPPATVTLRTTCRIPRLVTPGSSSRSALTTCSTCPSERRATSASHRRWCRRSCA
jgi:glucose/arabinose dehydrogenase